MDMLLRPNFWRAPTDNDFGANLHRRFVDWKNPGLKLKSFKAEEQGNRVQVVTTYELPRLAAVLTMTYLIGGNGEIRISEQLAVDKEEERYAPPVPFRYATGYAGADSTGSIIMAGDLLRIMTTGMRVSVWAVTVSW